MSYYKDSEVKTNQKIKALLSHYPDYVADYIRSIQFTTTSKTRLGYLTCVKHFLDYVADINCCNVKDMPVSALDALNRRFFEDYLDYLKEYEIDGKMRVNDLPSIKTKLYAIKGFFGYLYDEELISKDETTRIKIPKLRKKEIIRLESDEVTDFINTVDVAHGFTDRELLFHEKLKTRDLAITTLFLSTGMRISELVGINIKDIDLNRSCVHIIRKGMKQDTVYFSDECKNYLQAYYNERASINACEGHTDAFFLSNRQTRISVRNVQNLVKKYASVAVPGKHITPHKLRSTYGSMLYDATSDIYLVAQSLGHNSIDTSSKYYVTTSDKKKQENRNALKLNNNDDNN